ncbi:MAG: hypothetical protein OH319_02725 [Candidatus Parvarchaeota archaeon]|nr:hypothetical protein [Candidatus Jingweiarchaeum tengchongense]MCW1298283.1 hypothetical protein [Candidatus Jingweiarchaeum tengchongense]MCW1300374.1 hypothetical protein [Candidatus Jingweiarchaeum tengchongense]MCW1304781.1 hypothetical protein [Candidatus Jingweiarchaeum tengchongense]MCW1305371.1 hypothetical protein [Candidatus Jingweiarchaeum tengchongense]
MVKRVYYLQIPGLPTHWRKKKVIFEDGKALIQKWELIYDSGDALEPFYYTATDLLRAAGVKLVKLVDYYAFSERSQEWGQMEMKKYYQTQNAMALLKSIQDMYRSLIGMEKDLQRVNECLDYYKEKKGQPPDLVLKGIWVDFIDSRLGAGSIQVMSQQTQFFPLRDWFFVAQDVKDVDKLETNERIKNILKRKLTEYEAWKKYWKDSLEKMKKVLEERINAQQKSIELYKDWAKPLIRNVTELEQALKGNNFLRWISPDIIKIGETVYSYVKLIGYRDVFENEDNRYLFRDYVPCVEIDFVLRGSSPRGAMKTTMTVKAMIYEADELKRIIEEAKKDKMEEWFKNLYLSAGGEEKEKVKKKEEKKKEKSEIQTFFETLSGKEWMGMRNAWVQCLEDAWLAYDVTKKVLKIESWPYKYPVPFDSFGTILPTIRRKKKAPWTTQ